MAEQSISLGYASATLVPEGEDGVRIEKLWVDPEHRGKGDARRLLRKIKKDFADKKLWMRPRGFGDIPMGVEELKKFYESEGFKTMDKLDNMLFDKTAGQVFEAGGDRYDVEKLWELSKRRPIERLAVQDAQDYMKSRSWTGGKSPGEVLAAGDDAHGHMTRINKANLRYPVLLAPNQGAIDGMHRMAKATKMGKDTVPVRRFTAWEQMEPALIKKSEVVELTTPEQRRAGAELEGRVMSTKSRVHPPGQFSSYGVYDGGKLVGVTRVNKKPLEAWAKDKEGLKALKVLGPEVWIESTAVDPEHRGKGVAKTLRRHVQSQYSSVLTGTGPDSDPAMRHLNEVQGFKPVLQRGKNMQYHWAKTAELAEDGEHKLQGRKKFQGLSVAIENKAGSTRSGTDSDGHKWKTHMRADYGYIEAPAKGKDGDSIDAYVGPDKKSPDAFVVHQHKENGKGHDEDKVILGVRSIAEAKKLYLQHYDSPKFLGPVSRVPMERLKELVQQDKKISKLSSADEHLLLSVLGRAGVKVSSMQEPGVRKKDKTGPRGKKGKCEGPGPRLRQFGGVKLSSLAPSMSPKQQSKLKNLSALHALYGDGHDYLPKRLPPQAHQQAAQVMNIWRQRQKAAPGADAALALREKAIFDQAAEWDPKEASDPRERILLGLLKQAGIPELNRLPTDVDLAKEKMLKAIESSKDRSWSHPQISLPVNKVNLERLGFEPTRIAIPMPWEAPMETSWRAGRLHAHKKDDRYMVHADAASPDSFYGKVKHLIEDVPPAVARRIGMNKTAISAQPLGTLGKVLMQGIKSPGAARNVAKDVKMMGKVRAPSGALPHAPTTPINPSTLPSAKMPSGSVAPPPASGVRPRVQVQPQAAPAPAPAPAAAPAPPPSNVSQARPYADKGLTPEMRQRAIEMGWTPTARGGLSARVERPLSSNPRADIGRGEWSSRPSDVQTMGDVRGMPGQGTWRNTPRGQQAPLSGEALQRQQAQARADFAARQQAGAQARTMDLEGAASQRGAEAFREAPKDIHEAVMNHPLVAQHGMHPDSAYALLNDPRSLQKARYGRVSAAPQTMGTVRGPNSQKVQDTQNLVRKQLGLQPQKVLTPDELFQQQLAAMGVAA